MLRPVRASSMIRRRIPAHMVDRFLALGDSFFLSPEHRLRKRVNQLHYNQLARVRALGGERDPQMGQAGVTR
jgi:hypothetical protein